MKRSTIRPCRKAASPFSAARAAVLAAALAAAPALRAEPWSAWSAKPDAPFAARFEPAVDTRRQAFVRNDWGDGCASLYRRAPAPGELVLEKTHAESAEGAEALTVRVETAFVPGAKISLPVVPFGEHHASNPYLPFPAPSGWADPWIAVVEETFPAGAARPLRVPVRIPSGYWWRLGRSGDGPGRFFVRWEVRDGKGKTLARGILPDAFEANGSPAADWEVDARRTPVPDSAGPIQFEHPRATPSTTDAWPTLCESVSQIRFDWPGFANAFGTNDAAAVRFFRRAALIGVHAFVSGDAGAVEARLAAVAPDLARPSPLARLLRFNRPHGAHVTSFSQTTPGVGMRVVSKDQRGRWLESPAGDQKPLEPARIPGATLGRDSGAYETATVVFLLAFALGTVVLLVRFFARRRGEARLAVWRALPLWCAVSAAVALLALPLFLDRAPRADVTEWRYGAPGAPEELRVALGRSHSFSSGSAEWMVPADAWFFDLPSAMREKMPGTGPVETVDRATRVRTLRLPERERGRSQKISAARFAPHDGPAVEISPDPDARAEDFLWAAEKEPAEAEPAARDAFRKLLEEWTGSSVRRVPDRTVTARGDYDAVWVYARGSWYALGPMKAGESRALAASQVLQGGMDTAGKDYDNLFVQAPFALDLRGIVPVAEAWLARDAGKERPEADAETDDGGDLVVKSLVVNGEEQPLPPRMPKAAKAGGTPRPTRDFLERLDDAFAVALEARPDGVSDATAAQSVFLAPLHRAALSTRIVHLEVLP